ncbi:hypothetical protein PHJA_001039500 [Phtheirospermum japonicum]|uniref:Uncharacterized protein n=1 Tax=Phtheirospermum japonicum TaxID=374723 RepID=A0A830BVI4_9LAMI|nr:hypothetical protein PHJA_001039500 [Phtheirospermum japonicum]
MKVKGAKLVKQIISSTKAKIDAMKARVLVTSLTVLSKKKTVSTKINDAIDGIFRQQSSRDDQVIMSKAIVLYNNNAGVGMLEEYDCHAHDNYDDDKYPDLTHTLFDDEDREIADLMDDPDASTSAIDIVKNLKENEKKSFNLEDEIDEVADLFITKFHKRMRLQKLLSFKRRKEGRSV